MRAYAAIRWLVLVGSLVAYVGLFAARAMYENPQRGALRALIEQDQATLAELDEVRGLGEAAAREHAERAAARQELERRAKADPAQVMASFAALGVEPIETVSSRGGGWSRVALSLRGDGPDELARAARASEGADPYLVWRRLDVGPTGWAADLDLYREDREVEPLWTPYPEPEARWYSRFNEDLRAQLRAVRDAIETRRRELGPLAELPWLRARVQLLERFRDDVAALTSIRPALEPLVLIEPQALLYGAVWLEGERIAAEGGFDEALPREAIDARLRGAFSTAWEDGALARVLLRPRRGEDALSRPANEGSRAAHPRPRPPTRRTR